MLKIIKYYATKLNGIGILFILAALILSCERTVSVSPPDEPPPDGSLFINTAPSQAKIYINGRDRRRLTPDSINWLATGDYQITLKKEFFRDTAFMVSVVEGERTEVFVDYFSNPSMLGQINCLSSPANASIILDDVDMQMTTPNIIGNLPPGYHTVKFILEDHRTSEFTVIVQSSQITDAQATLVDTTIWQDYNTATSGLPSNSLTSVLADSRGIVWIGTLDDGLVRFENGVWTNYRESNSNINSRRVTCIEEGPKGNIWVGTAVGGVWEIELPSRTFQWNNKTSPLPDMHITDITRDGQVVIMFATTRGIAILERVAIDNGGSEESNSNSDWEYNWTETLTSSSGLANNYVTAIAVNGFYKWVGTEMSGVTTFASRNLMTTYTSADGLARNAISSIAADHDGVVWIGHNPQIHAAGGISTYNGSTWNNLSHLVHGEKVTEIFVDSENRKWVGTDRALYVIIGNSVLREFVYESTGLNFINVSEVSEDPAGNIWIATLNDGLVRARVNSLF